MAIWTSYRSASSRSAGRSPSRAGAGRRTSGRSSVATGARTGTSESSCPDGWVSRCRTGTSSEFGPNDVFDIAPGHDGYTMGDEPAITIEWSGVRGWLEPLESLNDRILATLLITDIVDSTGTAERLGQSRWNELLGRHTERMREVLAQFRGREIKTTGDGLLAISDGAARAVRCAARMVAVAPEDACRSGRPCTPAKSRSSRTTCEASRSTRP